MAQWINIGKYFFKWLSDLFSYCGGSCVCGFLFEADFGSRAFELLNSKKVKFQKFQNSGLAHKSWKITSNSVAGHCLSPNHQSRGVSDTFLIVQKFSRPVLVRFSTVQIFQTLELAELTFFKNHVTSVTKNRTKYKCFLTFFVNEQLPGFLG